MQYPIDILVEKAKSCQACRR